MASYYLELLKNPLNFPPVSRDINVFFDDCNKQVFAVSTENNMTVVHAKGPLECRSAKFKIEDKGSIVSIKFEVENPASNRNPQPGSLLERDVTVANIYSSIYVVVL